MKVVTVVLSVLLLGGIQLLGDPDPIIIEGGTVEVIVKKSENHVEVYTKTNNVTINTEVYGMHRVEQDLADAKAELQKWQDMTPEEVAKKVAAAQATVDHLEAVKAKLEE